MMRKTFLYSTIAVLGLAASLGACQKKEYTIGAPASKVEGIDGVWQVNEVHQVDETSPVRESMDLSSYFLSGSAPLEIEFSGSDFTYKVEANGSKNPFGTSGEWEFDNVDYPTYVHMYSVEGDSLQLKLGQTIRPSDAQLLLDHQRLCSDLPVLTYQYTFNRQ